MQAKYFVIEELVDRDTFGTLGEDAWQVLHPDIITVIDGVREFFGKPVTVNNWKWGGEWQYRGYRPPHCNIGAPQSYHRRGMALDFDVKEMDARIVRGMLAEHQNDPLLRLIQRIEADVNWCHVDLGRIPDGKNRIYFFKP